MPLPPPRQVVLSLLIERLHLKVPQWVGIVVLAVSIPTGAWLALRTEPPGPTPNPASPTMPLQQWAAALDVAPRLASSAVAGKLPAPDPRQRKPPCDPDLEREINGVCWVPVDVKPCPKGKAWVHEDGKCYAYALNAARLPSTGEPRPGNVAGGAQ